MKAADVMVRNVITVGPDSTVGEVAELLLANRISGMPVVDGNGKLAGIISEGDLLHRFESGTERHRSRWVEWLTPGRTLAAEFVKSHSHRVADIMTRHVITVSPDSNLDEVATTMESNGIKRMPVVEGDKLVGMITRANLVQALATLYKKAVPATVDDTALRESVIKELESQVWTHPTLLNVTVHNGAVDLWGVVESDAEKHAVRVAVEVTPGVKSVNDNLTVRPTDSYV